MMHRRRTTRRRLSALLLLNAAATTLATLLAVTDAHACMGTPRPVCARSTTLAKASTVVVPLPIPPMPVTVGVPFRVTVLSSGPCAPPLSTTVSMTAGMCMTPGGLPTGPGGAGSITFATPAPGVYIGACPVTFGVGPARSCTIVGTATTAYADGAATAGTGDTVICLVDPAPGDPSLPRLDLELLTPEIRSAHPGDQVMHTYRITNNDPTESVTLEFRADSEQAARLGTITGASPAAGEGTFALADPGGGDNFPIAFIEDLVPDPPPGNNYLLDDGTGEEQIGLGNDGSMLWLNQFEVTTGRSIITKISAAFGTVPNGTEYSVLLYDDPDNDGDPSDAVLLRRTFAAVENAGSGEYEEVKIVPTIAGGLGDSFFVAVVMQEVSASDLPALQDTDSDAGRSWLASSNEVCDLNVADLTDNPTPIGTAASFGLPGNLMVRALGEDDDFVDWIDLPADPPGTPIQQISRTLTICPGESIESSIVSRSWLGCPPGSACEQRLRLTGTYSDGTDALACAGVAHYVDIDVPPDFACGDGGTSLTPEKTPDGKIVFFGALPTHPLAQLLDVRDVQVFVEGSSAIIVPSFPEVQCLEPDTGRIIVSNTDKLGGHVAELGQPVIVSLQIQVQSLDALVQDALTTAAVTPASPAPGVVPNYFSIVAFSDATGPTIPPEVESFIESLLQVHLDGLTQLGEHVDAQVFQDSVNVQIMDDHTLGMTFEAFFPGSPTPGPGLIDDIQVIVSARGAAGGVPVDTGSPPCPQDLDGSGDVGFGDLLIVLSSWGPCPGCAADFDGSGDVGFGDLLQTLSAWGPCP